MKNFTKANVGKMNEEIAEVLNKYGFRNVNFSTGSARFSNNECTFKLTANIVGAKPRDQQALEMYAKRDGIDITKAGPKGEKLVEYQPRKRNYPYIYESHTGKRFRTSTEGAMRMFS